MSDHDNPRLERARQIHDRRQSDEADAPPVGTEQPATETDDTEKKPEAEATTERQPASTDRLLTVELGSERYAFDVRSVEEVIEPTTITRVPTTPAVVAGVVDLRGQVTTVLDPAEVLEPVEQPGHNRPIVVFDPEQTDHQSPVGWLVDEATQVITPESAAYREPPAGYEWMEGALRLDESGYVVVITPELIFERAAARIEAAFDE